MANAYLYEPQTVRYIADALDAALTAFAATPDLDEEARQKLFVSNAEQFYRLR